LLLLASSSSCFRSCSGGGVHNVDLGPRDLSVADLLRTLGATCSEQLLCGVGTCCAGICVDVTVDPNNCGGCGNACAAGRCNTSDGGVSHCGCDADVDGGTDGGGCSTLEPSCGANGRCTCGGDEAHQCAPPLDDQCQSGACTCAGQVCDPKLADHCDRTLSPPCRCGSSPTCLGDRADGCDPSSGCRCGDVAGCAANQFCCDT